MASFAELLGGQSLGRLEDAGYKSPKSEREGGVSFVPARRGHAAHSTRGASRQASDGSRENTPQSPAPVAESAPRRVRGVRPQAWRVTSGYSSHSRVGEVVAKKQRNDLGYAAVAEINCRRYCEGGENWYRLTQHALEGDVSPLVERGYLSQADADNLSRWRLLRARSLTRISRQTCAAGALLKNLVRTRRRGRSYVSLTLSRAPRLAAGV